MSFDNKGGGCCNEVAPRFRRGFREDGQIRFSLDGRFEIICIQSNRCCDLAQDGHVADVSAVGEVRLEHGLMILMGFVIFLGELSAHHGTARVGHEWLRVEARAHGFASLVHLLLECFDVQAREILFEQNSFRWCFRMNLIGEPFVFNGEFGGEPFLQSVDNTFADVTEGSDIIRIDGNLD